MKTNHTKDEQSEVQGIVEEFKKMTDYPKKAAPVEWLTQTLTHLQEQHEAQILEAEKRGEERMKRAQAQTDEYYQKRCEAEKRELVETIIRAEVQACKTDGVSISVVEVEDIKTIAAHHGLPTKQN